MKRAVLLVFLIPALLLAGDYKEGFQSLLWGDSLATVKRKYPKGKLHEGIWMVKQKTANLPAMLGMEFLEDKLWAVHVIFDLENTGQKRYLDEFQRLEAILTEKYGKPQNTVRENRSPVLTEDHVLDDLSAIALDEGEYEDDWSTHESFIMLRLSGGGFQLNLSIFYGCIELMKKHHEIQKKKDEGEL